MAIGKQMKEEGHDQNYEWFLFNFPFICYLVRICKQRVMNLKF